MTIALLRMPGRRPGALVAAGLDPRPCVTNDPRKWDVGDDGNAEDIALCHTCPAMDDDSCEIGPGVIRRGIPWGGNTYTAQPRQLKVCDDCGHPIARVGDEGIPRCKCPGRYRTTASLVAEWVERGGQNRMVKDVAAEMGVNAEVLKNALLRARLAGDQRIPAHLRRPSSKRQEAAA